MRVSIAIPNYNYARFVGRAIESALAQEHDDIEVVVVDDGSTDDSRDIIARYADRVTTVFQENGGQASAFNAGFERCTGDIVIFLDADDFLFPHAVRRIVESWRDGAAKAQYRLMMVDADEREIGLHPPEYLPFPQGNVLPELIRSGHYLTPVCSGNAYARRALSHILPMPVADWRVCADGYIATVAPFHGEVVSIEEPLGAYRLHGTNAWAFVGNAFAIEKWQKAIRQDIREFDVLVGEARRIGRVVPSNALLRNYRHVLTRLASLLIAPKTHPVHGDLRAELACDGLIARWRGPSGSTRRLLKDSVLMCVLGLMPRALARWIAIAKMSKGSTPGTA